MTFTDGPFILGCNKSMGTRNLCNTFFLIMEQVLLRGKLLLPWDTCGQSLGAGQWL